jgi:protein-disulfide isomerase-like protein with CxxC motif
MLKDGIICASQQASCVMAATISALNRAFLIDGWRPQPACLLVAAYGDAGDSACAARIQKARIHQGRDCRSGCMP